MNEDLEEDIVPIPSDEVLKLLGDDIIGTVTVCAKVNNVLAERWTNVLQRGCKKEVRQELLTKYPPIDNCQFMQAPKMNPEILATMDDKQIRKDNYQVLAQNQLGAAISATGSVLDKLLFSEDPEDQLTVQKLSDAVRLMCDLHHTMSLSRRSFFTPSFEKVPKGLALAENCLVDKLLYGEDFAKGVNAAKAAEKVGLNIKITTPVSPVPKSFQRKNEPVAAGIKNTRSLNSKGPPQNVPIVLSGRAKSMELQQAVLMEPEWTEVANEKALSSETVNVSIVPGRLKWFLNKWEKFTSDVTILDWVKGYRLKFNQKPVQLYPSNLPV